MEKSNDNNNDDYVGSLCDLDLLPSKVYYFFFFASYGALLPYMALHFKQMLLTASEVGALMGLKPFISFVVTPLWGLIADKFKIYRFILIISMISLFLSGTLIVLVPPPSDALTILDKNCNKTELNTWSPWASQRETIVKEHNSKDLYNSSFAAARNLIPKFYNYYIADSWIISMTKPYNFNKRSTTLNETFNSTTNGLDEYDVDATYTFIVIFFLLLFGTIIGCPALAIVDTATMKLLGRHSERYGKQRLLGSLGWGLAAFIVGALLTATHKCYLQTRLDIIDYKPCFYVYGILMFLALVASCYIKLNTKEESKAEKAKFSECFFIVKKPFYLMFLFVALLMGFEMAFIKTFLFWHLKDMGACQIIFSVISAVNCLAEVSTYAIVDRLINVFGQKGVIYMALGCYALRLFYYSVMPSPWWVLVVEILPGLTTAGAWASCLSYVNKCTGSPYYKTTMTTILHSVHWGLGYGMGEVIGGILVHCFGVRTTFIGNGVFCILTLILYYIVNRIYEGEDDAENLIQQIKFDDLKEYKTARNVPEEFSGNFEDTLFSSKSDEKINLYNFKKLNEVINQDNYTPSTSDSTKLKKLLKE